MTTIICVDTMATISRVSYGRDDTPVDKREYRVDSLGTDSPVGFISDWKDYAVERGLSGLRVIEKDGSVSYKIFESK